MILSCCSGKYVEPCEDLWVSVGYLQTSCWAVSLQHYRVQKLLGEILARSHLIPPAPPSEQAFSPASSFGSLGLRCSDSDIFGPADMLAASLPPLLLAAVGQLGRYLPDPVLSGVELLERQLWSSSLTAIYVSLSHL